MNITRETSTYNERRYGKPWIAKVDFTDPKGTFTFGDWSGDARNGGAGILSLNANPGEIVAIGLKDNRQPRNSSPDFYLVAPDGSLQSLGDKGAAYKHFLSAKSAGIDRAALKTERDQLLASLAEIDKLLV